MTLGDYPTCYFDLAEDRVKWPHQHPDQKTKTKGREAYSVLLVCFYGNIYTRRLDPQSLFKLFMLFHCSLIRRIKQTLKSASSRISIIYEIPTCRSFFALFRSATAISCLCSALCTTARVSFSLSAIFSTMRSNFSVVCAKPKKSSIHVFITEN